MGTIIAKNEELERELVIITRAFEIRDQSNSKINELEYLVGSLQNQLTEERKKTEEFQYIREQDNAELLKLENKILQL